MRVATAHHRDLDPVRAVREAYATLVGELGGPPQWLFVQTSIDHDREALRRALTNLEIPALHGSSSCLGVMTRAGATLDGPSLALFGLRDEAGNFGVGAATPDAAADP